MPFDIQGGRCGLVGATMVAPTRPQDQARGSWRGEVCCIRRWRSDESPPTSVEPPWVPSASTLHPIKDERSLLMSALPFGPATVSANCRRETANRKESFAFCELESAYRGCCSSSCSCRRQNNMFSWGLVWPVQAFSAATGVSRGSGKKICGVGVMALAALGRGEWAFSPTAREYPKLQHFRSASYHLCELSRLSILPPLSAPSRSSSPASSFRRTRRKNWKQKESIFRGHKWKIVQRLL